jgi:hypothetical protein
MEKPINMDEARKKFAHIKGWAIDADPENEPNYPYKKYTGDDHDRLNWERPPLQERSVEILQSTEHLRTPATFGTVEPPHGVSGAIRRGAFKFSENMLRHWFLLVLADRVDVLEGWLEDLGSGKVPNIVKERGLDALWEYDKPTAIKRTAIAAAIFGTVAGFLLTRILKDDDEVEIREKKGTAVY